MDPEFILSIYNTEFPGLDTLSFMELLREDYYYPARPDGAGWLQRAYCSYTASCPMKIQYTGSRLKCGNCDACRHQSSWKKADINSSECGMWETRKVPAVADGVATELPQTYVDEKGYTQRYYTDFAGATRIYYGTQKSGYRYCVRRNGKIQTNEDISCNGHLYVGPGGNFTLGIESGPTRL